MKNTNRTAAAVVKHGFHFRKQPRVRDVINTDNARQSGRRNHFRHQRTPRIAGVAAGLASLGHPKAFEGQSERRIRGAKVLRIAG